MNTQDISLDTTNSIPLHTEDKMNDIEKYLESERQKIQEMKKTMKRVRQKDPNVTKELTKLRNQRYYYKHHEEILEKARIKREQIKAAKASIVIS